MLSLFLSHYLSENMKPSARLALILAPLLLVACHKKEPEAAPAPLVVAAPAAAPAPAPAVAAATAVPAELSDEQRALANKQKALDYSKMEDQYINDPKAQWASTAKASSTYGDPKPSDSNLAINATGALDGKEWTNNNIDVGFDWLEVGFAKPVAATEVRAVITSGDEVGAMNKVELQDTEGKWHTAWEGISDVKVDARGPRTWFVRSFPKTPYKVQAVKYTIANNVERGYKNIDAVQLVGE
jgi:hypothetical protein